MRYTDIEHCRVISQVVNPRAFLYNTLYMSGHSKWAQIKRQKGVQDVKRGQAFTKLGNAITIAVKTGGGGDVDSNIRLRLAIDQARGANMPKENIQRAVDRGLGKGDGVILENVLYECFAPSGVAVLVEAVTDNKNRASGEIRNLFSKAGGSLGSSGSVAYLFNREGEIHVNKANKINETNKANKTSDDITLDEVMEKAMEAGADDVVDEGKMFIVYTKVDNLHQAKTKLEELGLTVLSASPVYLPNKETLVSIDDETKAHQVLNLLENLEELDDVQNVYSNLG